MLPAINGTEERLDAVLGALAALTAEVRALRPTPPGSIAGTVELREPVVRGPRPAAKGR